MLIQFCLRGLESLGKRVQPIWGEPYVFVFFRLLVLFVDSSLAVVLLLWFLFLGSSVFCASASLLLRCFVYTGELLLCFFAFCILRSLSAQSTMRVSRRAGNTRQQEDQSEEERQLRRRSRRKRTRRTTPTRPIPWSVFTEGQDNDKSRTDCRGIPCVFWGAMHSQSPSSEVWTAY